MTTLADDVKTLLTADSTLVASATGGIYTYDETRRYGISINDTPKAYDANGILLPTILVKQRSQTPDFGILDSGGQLMSSRAIIEIWLYNDGDGGFDILDTMRKRVYTVLAEKRVGTNKHLCRLLGHPSLNGRDEAMGAASYERSDYLALIMEPG